MEGKAGKAGPYRSISKQSDRPVVAGSRTHWVPSDHLFQGEHIGLPLKLLPARMSCDEIHDLDMDGALAEFPAIELF
jgi:hypothetical protein